ncbi:hypothetical protein D3C71_1544120 [compost metagenome]
MVLALLLILLKVFGVKNRRPAPMGFFKFAWLVAEQFIPPVREIIGHCRHIEIPDDRIGSISRQAEPLVAGCQLLADSADDSGMNQQKQNKDEQRGEHRNQSQDKRPIGLIE